MSLAVSDFRKIGIGLTAFGLAFTSLGVVLMFDKGLLAMGNVLFLSGVMMIIGPQRSVKFFFQKKKARGSCFFFAGMALVLLRSPVIGILIEAWGFINLFGDFFPIVLSFLRRVPILGNILCTPPIKQVCLFFFVHASSSFSVFLLVLQYLESMLLMSYRSRFAFGLRVFCPSLGDYSRDCEGFLMIYIFIYIYIYVYICIYVCNSAKFPCHQSCTLWVSSVLAQT